MKKILSVVLVLVLALTVFAACGKTTGTETTTAEGETVAEAKKDGKTITIAVPADTTNEARALILLENLGIIKLKDATDIKSTVLDIVENPFNVDIKEVEAAQLPNVLQDVDYAVINSNYAISAGLVPATDALSLEGAYSAYSNIVAVKEGNETTEKTKALVAALESQAVADYISETYNGSVVSTVATPGDGYSDSVDYASLAGQTITVAASPTPHCEILKIAQEILAEKDITLEIMEFTDYVQPNQVVESGEIDANYFQHTPYLDDFNAENGTHLISVASIHVEPLGIYGGKQADLAAVTAE